MSVVQPTLGKNGILFLLIALGAFPPLTMDLYLPALPQMTESFSTSRCPRSMLDTINTLYDTSVQRGRTIM